MQSMTGTYHRIDPAPLPFGLEGGRGRTGATRRFPTEPAYDVEKIAKRRIVDAATAEPGTAKIPQKPAERDRFAERLARMT